MLGVVIFGFQRDLWICFKEELLDSFRVLLRLKKFKITFVYGGWRGESYSAYFTLLKKYINVMDHVRDKKGRK